MRWQRRSHRRVRRWRSEGRLSCVVVYIEGLLFLFLIYWGNRDLLYPVWNHFTLSCSFQKQIRRRRRMPPILLFLFWIPFFFESKKKGISVCITVLYYILILIVHFSKSMHKHFAQNNIFCVRISKFSESSIPSPFKPFLKTPSTLKVIIDYKSGWPPKKVLWRR